MICVGKRKQTSEKGLFPCLFDSWCTRPLAYAPVVEQARRRAEKRKWLRHCPAASNMGSSARSFKMIGDTIQGILPEEKPPVFKVKKQGRQ